MVIKINGNEYKLKYSFRSMIIFEKIAQHSFQNVNNFTDILIYFYSTLIASNLDTTLSWDDFIDAIDEEPNKLTEFTTWLNLTLNKNGYITANENKDNNDSSNEKN